MNSIRITTILFALVMPCMIAVAQTFPTKPLRIVVAGVPGSGADLTARRVAAPLATAFNQSVIVENRIGASGLIAAQDVAKSAPDGHTLLYGTINDVLREFTPNAQFTLSRHFLPVTRLTSTPYFLVIHPSVKANNLKDLIALAKSKPAALTFASGAPGSGFTLFWARFKMLTGIEVFEVPYKSPGASIPDLLGGQVLVAADFASAVGQHIRSGKLKAIAVTLDRRSSALPDVPTTAEGGFRELETTVFGSILVPVGTPHPIVQSLNQQIAKIVNAPEFKAQTIAVGSETVGDSPEEFATFLRAEADKWGAVIKTAGLKLE